MTEKREEIFVSVDIEAAGPIAPDFSMLSLGACLVDAPEKAFYVEFKPINDNAIPEALAVSGFELSELKRTGTAPLKAMRLFEEWLITSCGHGKPIFVGFNATFDWAFVNFYFHHFIGRNPFGIGGVDIKAMYMCAKSCSWDATRSSQFPVDKQSEAEKHNALADARHQAELFRYVRGLNAAGAESDAP